MKDTFIGMKDSLNNMLSVLFLRYVQGPAVSSIISQNFWKIPNQPKGSGIQEW